MKQGKCRLGGRSMVVRSRGDIRRALSRFVAAAAHYPEGNGWLSSEKAEQRSVPLLQLHAAVPTNKAPASGGESVESFACLQRLFVLVLGLEQLLALALGREGIARFI